MTYIFDIERRKKVEQFQEAAREARRVAIRVDELALLLNESGENCDCCGSTRYFNWPQRQLRARVAGTSERLREIADVFERRANDNEFLNGTPAPTAKLPR